MKFRNRHLVVVFVCMLAFVVACDDDDIPTLPPGPFLLTDINIGSKITPPQFVTTLNRGTTQNFVFDVAYTLGGADAQLAPNLELCATFIVRDAGFTFIDLDGDGFAESPTGGNPLFLFIPRTPVSESGVEHFDESVGIPLVAGGPGNPVVLMQVQMDFFDTNASQYLGVNQLLFSQAIWDVQ